MGLVCALEAGRGGLASSSASCSAAGIAETFRVVVMVATSSGLERWSVEVP